MIGLYPSEARDILNPILQQAKFLYLFPVGRGGDNTDIDSMRAYQVYIQESSGKLRDISGLLSRAFEEDRETCFFWFTDTARAANTLPDEIYGMMDRRSEYSYRVQVL